MDEQFSAEYITFRDTLGYVKLAIFFSGIRVAFFSDHRAHFRWNKTASEKGASDMGLDGLKHILKNRLPRPC